MPSPPDQIIPVLAEIADITSDLPEFPFPVANFALQVGGMTTTGTPNSRNATLTTPPSSPMEWACECREAYEYPSTATIWMLASWASAKISFRISSSRSDPLFLDLMLVVRPPILTPVLVRERSKPIIFATFVDYYSFMDRIFVAIPSFQEEDLVKTVESIFEMADNPDRVFVGICNQRSDGKDFETFDCFDEHVRVVDLRSPFPLGLGHAYYLASQLLQEEEFVLRVDAHTRMKDKWDSVLIEYFKKIQSQENAEKIIISHLTGGFYKINLNKEDFIKSESEDIWVHEKEPPNLDSWMDNLIWQLNKFALNSEHKKQTNYAWSKSDLENGYKEVHMISGSFHFSTRDFLFDCEADPRLFFWGEEHVLAMRAWTRGYRIYGIKINPQYTGGKPDAYLESVGLDDWRNKVQQDQRFNTVRYASAILKGKELGFYGAKDKESHDAYMRKLGLDKFACDQ